MAPLRRGLTAVRRVVGVAAVLFLLGCAVFFYRAAPGFSTSESRPHTAADSPAGPAPTSVGTPSGTTSGVPSTAGPSPTSDSGPSTSTATPGPGENTGPGSAEEATIQLEDSVESAEPFQTVAIRGRYRGGADTFLRVQRWEGRRWLAFPLPTKTDQSGRFTAYVELGQPGRYRLRVLDPDSGVKSETFVLVIRG